MSENIQSASGQTTSSKIIEKTYRASAEDLGKMWTTKDGFQSWWAPEGFRIVVHTIEARENGQVLYDIIAESPEVVAFLNERGLPIAHLERCRFSIFRPVEQLEFRIMMDFVPGVEPYENVMLIDFVPIEDGVRMVVTLSPMYSEEFREICAETLGRQFTELERQLTA